MHLLSTSNTKILKGQAKGYLSAILHLAPANLSGYNVCPASSAGCRSACLNTAGMGAFTNVQDARIEKTRWFFQDRPGFMGSLVKDITSLVKKAARENLTPTIRLNGTSDIRWELYTVIRDGVSFPSIFEAFPQIQFYDYTKLSNRRNLLDNYHLTFSLSENNDVDAIKCLKRDINVAGVFREFPKEWNGFPTINGDEDDLRFLDPVGVVVVLTPKGKAKKDMSGFVR